MATAVRTALSGVRTESDALREIVVRDDPASPNRRLHEVIGYARLLLGDLTRAHESPARAGERRSDVPWPQAIIERARDLVRLLDEGGIDQAVGRLEDWCRETAAALRLQHSDGS